MENFETSSNQFFTKTIYTQQWISTNLKNRFLVTPKRGNKYLYSLYYYYRNSILLHLTKKKMDNYFIRVLQDPHGNLTRRGLKTNYI